MHHGHYLECDEKLPKNVNRGVRHLALEKHCSGLLTEEGIRVGTGGQDGGGARRRLQTLSSSREMMKPWFGWRSWG